MKRQIPGMLVGMFFLLCTLKAIGFVKENEITMPRQDVYEQEEGKGNPSSDATHERLGRKRGEEKESQEVTAEAARREMREYNIQLTSVLVLLFGILLFLLIKQPAEKRKRKGDIDGSNYMYRRKKKRKKI